MRVLEGVVRTLKSGRSEALPPFRRSKRIDTAQVQTLAAKRTPELVQASNPVRDKEGPKNQAWRRFPLRFRHHVRTGRDEGRESRLRSHPAR